MCKLLRTFALALTTISLENPKDTDNISDDHTLVVLWYCGTKATGAAGGRAYSKQSSVVERPLLQVCAIGPLMVDAVVKNFALLTSHSMPEANRPDIDLEWIVCEEGMTFVDSVEQKVV